MLIKYVSLVKWTLMSRVELVERKNLLRVFVGIIPSFFVAIQKINLQEVKM